MNLTTDVLRNKKPLAALSAVLLLGSILRFYRLGYQSLWTDELCSWHFSRYDSLSAVFDKGLRPELHPPGYYILLHLVQKHIGSSEPALRSLSAICGVLSMVGIFLVGRRLYSIKEALIASGLMAVLWCPIYHSQEARPESMLLAFTLLATYFWISILQSVDEKLSTPHYSIAGYIITASISTYSHYVGVYFIALQGLGAVLFLARRPRALLRILLIYVPIVLAYVPWVPTLLYQVGHSTGRISFIEQPTGTAFVEFLLYLFNGSVPLLAIVLILVLFTAAVSLFSTWKSTQPRSMRVAPLAPGFILALWLIVPFAGAYVGSALFLPVLEFRTLIVSLPAAYLLLSRSIARLPLRTTYQALVTVALLGLFLFDLVFVMGYYSEAYKEQYRGAASYVIEHDELYEDSLIIGYTGIQDWEQFFDYYFERAGFARRVDAAAGRERDIPEIDELIASRKPRYMWYLVRTYFSLDQAFVDYLDEHFTLVEREGFIGIDVWLFENDSSEYGGSGGRER